MSDVNKFTLLDVEGLADVVNNLIDKLAAGAGWIVNRETLKKTALKSYIEDIQNSDYSPLEKAALITHAKKSIKEYCNQKDIVGIALKEIEETAKPESVDDDWIAIFMDNTRLVSDERFQFIWGRVLATECNKPKSIPRALLYILAQMDKEDAEVFTTLCSMAVKVEEECSPVITQNNFEDYSKYGITFDKLVNLKALGLIEMDFGRVAVGYSLEAKNKPVKVNYFNEEYISTREKLSIDVGNVIFTKFGNALCQAIKVEMIEGFWEKYCLPLWNY